MYCELPKCVVFIISLYHYLIIGHTVASEIAKYNFLL